jgi:hypothetical protein
MSEGRHFCKGISAFIVGKSAMAVGPDKFAPVLGKFVLGKFALAK